MIKAPVLEDETQRLASLNSLRIMDTPSEECFDRITRMARRLFDVKTCLVSLVDEHRLWIKSRQGTDIVEAPREVTFCAHAIAHNRLFIVDDATLDPRFADNPLVTEEPHVRFYAGCPLRGPGGYRIGALCLIDTQPRHFDEEDRVTLRDLAAMVEGEFALVSQTTVDELTQVANRRGFNSVAGHMLSLCRRTGAKAELLFFDLDDFKDINDSFGHSAGDEMLQHFAGLLLQCFRSADVVARLGGDEFVVLLAGQETDAEEALRRLARDVANDDCEIRRLLKWSAGHVRYDPSRHDSVEDLLKDADALMYENKSNSRGDGA